MAGVLHRRIYLPAVTSGCTDLHSSHFSHGPFAQLERRDVELLAAVNSNSRGRTVGFSEVPLPSVTRRKSE